IGGGGDGLRGAAHRRGTSRLGLAPGYAVTRSPHGPGFPRRDRILAQAEGRRPRRSPLGRSLRRSLLDGSRHGLRRRFFALDLLIHRVELALHHGADLVRLPAKLSHELANPARKLWELLRPQQEQRHDQDERDFAAADVQHVRSTSLAKFAAERALNARTAHWYSDDLNPLGPFIAPRRRQRNP